MNEKSKIPFAIGLTLVISGSLYTLYGLFGGLISLMVQSMFNSFGNMFKMADAPFNPTDMLGLMKPLQILRGLSLVLAGIISIFAIVGGAGLMKYKEWGIKLSLGWAAVALFYLLADTLAYFFYVLPHMQKAFERISKEMSDISGDPAFGNMASGIFSSIGSNIGGMTIILTNLFMAILPMVTIVFIMRYKKITKISENK